MNKKNPQPITCIKKNHDSLLKAPCKTKSCAY